MSDLGATLNQSHGYNVSELGNFTDNADEALYARAIFNVTEESCAATLKRENASAPPSVTEHKTVSTCIQLLG
eukprot:4211696-Prymnesium_polylepis.1